MSLIKTYLSPKINEILYYIVILTVNSRFFGEIAQICSQSKVATDTHKLTRDTA